MANILTVLASRFLARKQQTQPTNVIFSVVLPIADNDGNSLAYQIENIKIQIRDLTGGYSFTRQAGSWLDNSTGIVYDDESILVTTVCTNEQAAILQSYSAGWCTKMRQEALLCLVYSPVSAIFAVQGKEQAA